MKKIQSYVTLCSRAFQSSLVDQADYAPMWNGPASNATVLTDTETNFIYTGDDFSMPFFGQTNWFPRGGYIANLASNYDRSIARIDDLEENNWIDIYTRAVFVEFGTLNANLNLFSFVTIGFEFVITGDIVFQKNIESIQLYRYIGGAGLLNIMLEIITVIFAIVITVQETREFFKDKKKFIQNMWNWVTVIAFILFYAGVGVYAWKSVLTVKTVEDVKNEAGKEIIFHKTL